MKCCRCGEAPRRDGRSYCLLCERTVAKEWRTRNKDRITAYNRRNRYKVPFARALEMGKQTGCEVCGEPQVGRPLALDHNHETGRVRGLLCYSCNAFVGFVEKRGYLLTGILSYVAKHMGDE
jgi:hypothetical protein